MEGRQMFEAKNYKQAVDKLRIAKSLAEKEYGNTSSRYKASVELLAKCYDAVGLSDQSIVLYKALKDINTKENNTQSREHADLLESLGKSYFNVFNKVKRGENVSNSEKMEMLSGAISSFKFALELREKQNGKNSREYLLTLHQLAQASINDNEERSKVPDYYESLHEGKQYLGELSEEYIQIVEEYADILIKTRKIDEAEARYEEHISLLGKAGRPAKETLSSKQRLAKINVVQKDEAGVKASYDSFLDALKKTYGAESKQYSKTLDEAIEDAVALDYLYYLDELYDKKLETVAAISGKQDKEYARVLYERSKNQLSMANLDQAAVYAAEAKELFKATLGTKHPDYADANDLNGRIKEAKGEQHEAEQIFQASQTLRKTHLGTNHPEYTQGLDSLGHFYLRQGKVEKAEMLFRESMTIREKDPGKTSADYGASLGHIAEILRRQGNYEEEGKVLEQQRVIFGKEFGVKTPAYAMIIFNLAENAYNQGNYQEAMSKFQEALELFKSTGGGANLRDKAKRGFVKSRNAKAEAGK